MSLALAEATQGQVAAALADPASDLTAWAAQYECRPVLMLGYRRPTGAEGWPYVAVEPAADTRNLLTQRAEAGAIALAVGFRLARVERGDADGIRAVEALASAVLAALVRPWRVDWGRERWVAQTAERTDRLFVHPTYEVELRLSFGRIGVDV
jgi:hypothetical protein